ncbi:GNAT family N-acetyltransferase [Oscillospiraceae bacterium OttesenSCG-928-G22]|nr:GNAT family N-acetyltransferase [Oscillospiraceae bacterium OttesenSCG-928-G22]
MRIERQNIVIRDFERKDAEDLYRIVREKNILRFMPDWAEGKASPQDYYSYIDWRHSQRDSTDIYEDKRYAVALPATDEMIGMVGIGLEDTLHEVEMAYFMSEQYQRRGYAKEAIDALAGWCFRVSDVPYLMLTIDIANEASCNLAVKCGFELFEKRTPIGHRQVNMESDSYFYYRKYR